MYTQSHMPTFIPVHTHKHVLIHMQDAHIHRIHIQAYTDRLTHLDMFQSVHTIAYAHTHRHVLTYTPHTHIHSHTSIKAYVHILIHTSKYCLVLRKIQHPQAYTQVYVHTHTYTQLIDMC